jgi:hypothetical protein
MTVSLDFKLNSKKVEVDGEVDGVDGVVDSPDLPVIFFFYIYMDLE